MYPLTTLSSYRSPCRCELETVCHKIGIESPQKSEGQTQPFNFTFDHKISQSLYAPGSLSTPSSAA